MFIYNRCIFTLSDTDCCETIIDDNELFCNKHSYHEKRYKTFYDKRIKSCRYNLNKYLCEMDGTPGDKKHFQSIFRYICRNIWCMEDNDFNNKLLKLFTQCGCENLHGTLCMLASDMYNRRRKPIPTCTDLRIYKGVMTLIL